MNENTSAVDPSSPVSRRTIIQGAAWTIPVIAVAAAAPSFAATGTPRTYGIESSFGIGWYATTQGQTQNGALQYDSDSPGKYHRITGTQPGDVITDVYIEVLISTGWPAPSFSTLPGSNPLWTSLVSTNTTTVVNGVTYRVYRSNFVGPIVATAPSTSIPVDFYWRSASPFYAGQSAITRRFATVNGTNVALIRNPAAISNTNVLLSNAPTP